MLFKRLYSPDSTNYPRIFSAFAPMSENSIDTGAGLIAGNSYLTSRTVGLLTRVSGGRSGLSVLRADGVDYTGMTETIRLYPSGSPFAQDVWALALLVPEDDYRATVRQSNILFYGVLIALFAVSLFAAMFISRRYIRPLVSALNLIKSDSRSSLQKTQIAEIDDLLEYLAAMDEERKVLSDELEQTKLREAGQEPSPPNILFERFLKNLETLTATERAVFNLYMEDKTAQMIAGELFITINTVKFHNKNIYGKLGVSSLEALKVYVSMMKEGASSP
jgi:DNA-binding CsgD family transcriptional regulator